MAVAIIVPAGVSGGPYQIVGLTSGGAGATTTFDPSNKSTHITLSGGNLVSTSGAGSSNSTAVRSVASHSTGKFYCEFTLTSGTPGGNDGCGLCNGSFVIDGGSFLGNNSNSCSYFNGGSYFGISGAAAAPGSQSSGDIIGMAVDAGAALIWFRRNGGQWNSDGLANPATGAGGGTFTISGALFAAVEGEVSGDTWTANFGGSAYANAAPSGFGNW